MRIFNLLVGFFLTMSAIAPIYGQRPMLVNSTPTARKSVRSYSVAAIKKDLKNIPSVVPLKPTGAVQRIIHRYLYENRSQTEEMIGRAYLYFPLFDRMMAEYDAPEELKYLAVIESSLRPTAKSRVGAQGIWQFMPETAREYGLVINNTIDERLDPEKSTLAAIQYLTRSQKRFNSWTLALAAYNSGGGRVNRAVRRAHSKNFWKLQKYLPRETRSYIPAFIAATYVLNHYAEYGLEPVFPARDLYLKTKIKLKESFSFTDLADILGIEAYTLQALNPAFIAGFIPANSSIYIPESVYPQVQSYFNLVSNHDVQVNASFVKQVHYVTEKETIWEIAQNYRCTPQAIMDWNGLTGPNLSTGDQLVIYEPQLDSSQPPVFALPKASRSINVSLLAKLPALKSNVIFQEATETSSIDKFSTSRKRRTKIKKYTIRKTTSLNDMANWLGVSLEDLIELNKELAKSNQLTPGTIITVPGN